MRKIFLVFAALFLFPTGIIAQNKIIHKKAPVLTTEPSYIPISNQTFGNRMAENYIMVDVMANAFGAALSMLNPLAYDPWANVAAVVHRGHLSYAAGSGQMWYNISTDKGVSWTRVNAPINTDPILGRYPNMAISNHLKGSIEFTTSVYSWPELTPTVFGFIGYGADQPVGNATTYSDTIQGPPQYSSQIPCWASDNTPFVFWASDNQDNAGLTLFRTEDFATVNTINPPQWHSSIFQDGGNISLGGTSHNGVQYYAIVGTVMDPNPGNPIISGWYPAYSKSTDNGATWSDWKVADFRTIPATSAYDRLWDWRKDDPGIVNYQGDIIVDNSGYVHLILGVTDTTVNNNSGNNAIIEVFETGSGWDAKIIADLGGVSDSTNWLYGSEMTGLNQTGYSAYLSKSPNGDILAAQWLVGSPETANTLIDIYYSKRSLTGEWEVPINLTSTNGIGENIAHMSPMLADNGNNTYTFFSMYAYDASGANPPDETAPTNIYIAPVTFSYSSTPFLIVNSPNGGEDLAIGTDRLINWASNKVNNVKIEYTTDLGSSWITIINSTPSDGYYTWTIPNTPSSNCKIKITDVTNTSITDESNNPFSISSPSITITSPNGGENWLIGSLKNITYNSNLATVKIEYSTNSGTSWILVVSSASNTGSYSWTIPNTPSVNCKVRISDTGNPSINDVSDNTFSIVPPTITVTSPNGGESWMIGSIHNITWTSSYVSNVKIQYTTNNGSNWITIINSTSSDGVYVWTIPNVQSSQCKIKITSTSSSDIFDTSDEVFSIFPFTFYADIAADSVWIDSEYNGLESAQVDGSGSYINQGSITSYEWFVNNVLITNGITPTIELSAGTNIVKLVVHNNTGLTASDSMYISVYSAVSSIGNAAVSGISQYGKNIFVSSKNNGVYKIDSTGTVSQFFLTGGSINSSVCISNQTSLMYTGSGDTRLYCFDTLLNSIWDKGIGGIADNSASINYNGDIVYTGSNDNNANLGYMKSFNASDGSLKWSFQTDGLILSSPAVIEFVDSNNVIKKTLVYFSTSKGTVYSLEDLGNSYQLFWSKTTSPDSAIISSAAVSQEGMIYIGSKNGYLYRFNWNGDSETTWKKLVGGKIISSPVIDESGIVYIASGNGYIYGLQKDFVVNSVLLKSFYQSGGIDGTPAIGFGGTLYAGCNNGRFIALDKNSSGEMPVKWYFKVAAPMNAPALVTENGIVYIGSVDGKVFIMRNPGTKDLSFTGEWPAFKGNNQRSKVVRLSSAILSADDKTVDITSYGIEQNYPNPFNPSTSIKYSIPYTSAVKIEIFNILGESIDVILNTLQEKGFYEIKWDAGDKASGIYFYNINAESEDGKSSFNTTKKMILMR